MTDLGGGEKHEIHIDDCSDNDNKRGVAEGSISFFCTISAQYARDESPKLAV